MMLGVSEVDVRIGVCERDMEYKDWVYLCFDSGGVGKLWR